MCSIGITSACANPSPSLEKPQAQPQPTPQYVSISFYYDKNLNGIRDQDEILLKDLETSSDLPYKTGSDGSILVPKYSLVKLFISGKAPNGKPLINATFDEPKSAILLQDGFLYTVNEEHILLGLADGYLTSPIKPNEMKSVYQEWLDNPPVAQWIVDFFYPKGWKYPFNYFFYGYKFPEELSKGEPHLAFDISADTGVDVYAAVGGDIVEGINEYKFGIQGQYGTVYYNHIDPLVRIGQKVSRYDIVGHIDSSGVNHVHFELRPNPERILTIFPGVENGAMLTSPFRGEGVFKLPYFQ